MPEGVEIRGLTIDSRSTRDIDDAIWIERDEGGAWKVFVSIADVAASVPIGSEVDDAAKGRVTTKYFATGNSPMLPRDLSEDRCSLRPKTKRDVLTVEMHLTSELALFASNIYSATLTSEAQLAYDDVPRILEQSDHPFHEVIAHAARLSVGLMDRRRQNGAFVLYDMNNGWVTTEEGFVRQLKSVEETIGYVVIQELMVLANSAVADYAVARNVPILFRNHLPKAAAPDRSVLMRQVEGALAQPVSDIDIVRERVHRLLGRADYGATAQGHYGLNAVFYTHFSSPIRRYADLVNHRQIRAAATGSAIPYTQEQLAEIAEGINSALEEERNATSERMRAKAENRAARVISARRLDGLNAKEFERVTKIETRSGRGPSEAFSESFRQRLKKNRVPLICATTIFIEAPTEDWKPLQHAVVSRLTEFPADAQSLFTQAAQCAQWPNPVLTVTEEGPDHARVFTAKAMLPVPNGAVESDSFAARTSKEAKQRALVGLLAKVCGAPSPAFEQERAPTAPVSKKRVVTLDLSKDPVSALQEYAQGVGIAAPDYSFSQSGAAHAPAFSCTCTLAGNTATGTGTSKAHAKKVAAKRMVDLMTRPTTPAPGP